MSSTDGIPEGWTTCPKQGQLVEGTRFVPLKTPIGRKYEGKLLSQQRFSPREFYEEQKRDYCRKINALICFCSTTDRYDSEDLKMDDGVQIDFCSIPIGREMPTDEQYQKFADYVERKLLDNKEAFFGVHCTHGFNRTGFMIVRYLCEHENLDVIKALERFRAARTPGIYDQSYVDVLLEKYGKEKGSFKASGKRPEI